MSDWDLEREKLTADAYEMEHRANRRIAELTRELEAAKADAWDDGMRFGIDPLGLEVYGPSYDYCLSRNPYRNPQP